MRLVGKRALITGGGTGIGRATAERLAYEGADVVIVGRRRSVLEETKHRIISIGGKGSVVQGDVSRSEDAERIVEQSLAALGGLDILVNNAGINVRNASVTSVSLSDWSRVLEVNLTGVFLMSRFALKPMLEARRGGAIVNVSSLSGIFGDPNLAPYNAAKGGVTVLTKNMAVDYAKYGVRVNAVCPGRVDTPMPMTRLGPGESWEDTLAEWGRNVPLGRVGRPEDVASAILFFASDDAGWITGATLVVDGGVTASHPFG